MTTHEKKSATFSSGGAYHAAGTLSKDSVLDHKFLILAPLGHGGMGQVYAAEHTIMGTKVAIKVMHTTGIQDELAKQRFRREARLLAELDHPHIVRIHDAGITSDGLSYVAMELLSGETLRDWVKRHPLAERNDAFIRTLIPHLTDIAKGLGYAHGRGVIHRDIKLSNMFLHREANDGQAVIVPKIIDFGIAIRAGDAGTRLTMSGEIPGTRDYMAPEVAHGAEPDARSDIYSFGVALFEALADIKPDIRSKDKPLSARNTARYRLIPPHAYNPNVPRWLDQLCIKALAAEPTARFQDVQALLTALSGLDRKTTGTDAVIRTITEPKKRVVRFAAMGVAALLGLAITLMVVMHPRPGKKALPSRDETLAVTPLVDKRAPTPRQELKSPIPQALPDKASPPVSVPESPLPDTGSTQPPAVKPFHDTAPPKKTGSHESPAAAVGDLIRQADEKLGSLDLAGAEQLYKEANRMNPNAGAAWYGLGKVAFEKSDYQTAEQYMKNALHKQNVALWHINLGTVYERQKRTPEAIAEWQRVVDGFPDNLTAQSTAREHLKRLGADRDSQKGSGEDGE